MTYREILTKEKDIEVEHYEAVDFTPMSAVYVGCYAIYYFVEDVYGETPMDKEPIEVEEITNFF